MHIAIIGAGRIGQSHVKTLSQVERITKITVADIDLGHAQAAAAASGGSATTNLDDVLTRGKVDGVVIAAPTNQHADLIKRAVENGIPVFCEKPVAEDLQSTIDVVNHVKKYDVPVQIGFQRRFDAGYKEAKAQADAGKLGEVRRIHMITADPTPPPAAYIKTSGGLFRDCHIHDFDIVRFVTGQEVVSVYAIGVNRGADFFTEYDDVDEAVTIMKLTDGTLVTMQGSRYNGGGYDVRMEVAGTEGTAVVGYTDRSPWNNTEDDRDKDAVPWPDFQTRFAPAYFNELEEFVTVAAGEAQSRCTPADALEALRTAEAADLSRKLGREVLLSEIPGLDA